MSAISPAKTYEIRTISARVGYATYPRPVIVADVSPNGIARVHYLSTKDYSERGQSFCIRSDHPDFAATGLEATSFTVHPMKILPKQVLKGKRGDVIAELAREFQDWLGEQ